VKGRLQPKSRKELTHRNTLIAEQNITRLIPAEKPAGKNEKNSIRGCSIPIHFLRNLSGKNRNSIANRQLARLLAFNAGAANAGGFLAVRQYTSHMTGIVSSMADNLALSNIPLLLAGFGSFLSFLAGAACTAILVNWGRRRNRQSEYAFPLFVEAALMLCFGVMGASLEQHRWLFVPATVVLLCFMMGLQNAIITKISKAEIRTTHVTGIVTDIGIELGKLFYWSRMEHAPAVAADKPRLLLLASLLGLFFCGGVLGAICFKHVGFIATVPLALLLVLLAIVPVVDDLSEWLNRI